MTQCLSSHTPSLLSLPSVSDRDLLAAVAASGDRSAFGELARRYVDFVFASAVRQISDRHAAEDITQAVFIVLLNKAGAIRPEALAAWLHQTTQYTVSNARRVARRRRKHEQAGAKPEAIMPSPISEPDPLLPLLDTAIASLGTKDRIAVIERYLRGKDAAAIGELLGASPKAAQKRLDRAIVRLREKLAQDAQRCGVSGGGLTAALAAAAPSAANAAPPAILAHLATAPVTAATATPTATLVHGVLRSLFWAKVKLAAIIGVSLVCAGLAAETTRRIVIAAQSTQLPTVSPDSVSTVSGSQNIPPWVTVHAKLRSGVAIDYLGVAANPSLGTTWYDPDGHPLPTPPFESAGMEFGGQNGIVPREFAFATDAVSGDQVDGTPTGLATIRMDGPLCVPRQVGSQLMRAMDADGTPINGRRSVVLPCETGKPVTIRFALATGPWAARIASQAGADVNIIAQDDIVRAQISQPFEDNGQVITLYWPAEFRSQPDKRLVAIDTDGQVHMPQQVSWTYKSPAQRAAEPMLDVIVPAMRFNNTQLDEALQRVSATTGVQIDVDWDGLAKIGIAKTLLLSTRTGQDRLSVWLPMLLQDVRGHGGSADWTIQNGVIKLFPFDWRTPHPIAYGVPNLPLAKLARFEVQTRAFNEWIEFAGLRPELGKAAHVTVHTGDEPAPPSAPATRATGAIQALQDGTAVELVALGDASAGTCWRPDGVAVQLPFDFKPDPFPQQLVGSGNRQVWAMFVTRRKDGQLADCLAEPVDAVTGASAVRYQQAMTMNDHRYQVIECSVDAKAALDWHVSVPSKPPMRVSLERSASGWSPTGVARLNLGDAGEAVMWGVSGDEQGTSVRVWTPPALGPDLNVAVRYVQTDGRDDSGHTLFNADANGFRWARSQDPADRLQRVTLEVTHYDQSATFRGVALAQNKPTK